jgi:uncharacterized protein YbjT (DUF2867 family)
MILITGAAGKTGQAVIRALVQRNRNVRALVHRQEQIQTITALGTKEVVVGDMQNERTLGRAIDGCSSMYHICPAMHRNEFAIGKLAVTKASESGVTHFVFHSVLHPQTKALPHHYKKLHVEEKLLESKLNYTILQPAVYMQNLLNGWERIVGQGIYEITYSKETRLGMVDLVDIAEVAAKVLTEPGHVGAIYELAGPEVLNQTEIATIMSDYLNHPVRVEQISLIEWKSRAYKRKLTKYQVETLSKMYIHYDQHGFSGNPQVLSWLLKKPPGTLSAFMERVMTRPGI